MSAAGGKEVLYIYNDNEATADLEIDADGSVLEPPSGSIIKRNGKPWMVAHTRLHSVGDQRSMMPILKINLTDEY